MKRDFFIELNFRLRPIPKKDCKPLQLRTYPSKSLKYPL